MDYERDSVPEWLVKNRDGFRPIKRIQVGLFGKMGGNAGITSRPFWDDEVLFFCIRFLIQVLTKAKLQNVFN
ncbi:MAG: hypothetical protein M0T74_18625 [Desulfitobacterium hafniense]|nr:hypothetical protein [Desulfitobacterium hafniense]